MHIQTHTIDVIVFQFIGSLQGIYYDLFITIIGGVFAGVVVAIGMKIVMMWNYWRKCVKIKKVISGEIILMFQDIVEANGNLEDYDGSEEVIDAGKEKFDKWGGEQWVWKMRQFIFYAWISQLMNLVGLNYVCLKQAQFTELIDHLNTINSGIKLLKEQGGHASKRNYEVWLEGFKKMKWLKIDIEKLNWVDDNS